MTKIDELVELSKRYCKENNYEEALYSLNSALVMDSSRADIFFEIGKVNFIIGNFTNSQKFLEKAIFVDTGYLYAYDLLIKIYNQNNDYNSLNVLFNKLLSFFQNKKYVDYIDLVFIMFSIGEYINKYENIIEIIKNNIKDINKCSDEQKQKFILLISNIYYKKGYTKKSLIYKYKYLSYDKTNIEIITDIIKDYIALNRIKKAYNLLKFYLMDKNFSIKEYKIWEQLIIILEKDKNIINKEDLKSFLEIIPTCFIKFRNILLNELEIIDNKFNLLSKPRTFVVTLTSSCNIRCIMCRAHRYPWQLPEKTKNELLELMPYLSSVVWLGGEVFLYKYFDELFDAACKNNVSQEIITNAMLLNEDIIIKLLKNDVNLAISVDGITKEVFEHIRVGASFEKLIENLELIKFYKKNLNSYKHYRMNSLIFRSNYKQIEDFVEFAHKYEFNNLFINGISSDFFSQENIFYYYKDDEAIDYLDSVRDKIRKKANDYGIELHNTIPTKEFLNLSKVAGRDNREQIKNLDWINKFDDNLSNCSGSKFCLVPWKKLMIDRDGYVRPDCFCREERPIGNILNNSLFDIWNSKQMMLYRKVCLSKNNLDNLCQIDCLDGRIEDAYRK